jgi:ATP-dependent helicase/nuclease subunit A
VLLRREDGTLLEGVVDLAFEEGEGDSVRWKVVDFKTDRELESSCEAYMAQVAMYSEAIGKATGAPVESVLLVI